MNEPLRPDEHHELALLRRKLDELLLRTDRGRPVYAKNPARASRITGAAKSLQKFISELLEDDLAFEKQRQEARDGA